jgi:hypothetical protein
MVIVTRITMRLPSKSRRGLSLHTMITLLGVFLSVSLEACCADDYFCAGSCDPATLREPERLRSIYD